MDSIQKRPGSASVRSYSGWKSGRAQLSLVEHALCPLDCTISLKPGFTHQASYFFTDKHRNRKKASVRVHCGEGLNVRDEFYLWGLLAMTLAQAESGGELNATPHYCLRQLGCIENSRDKGSENYRSFRDAIERLSAVTYQNDHFFDPLRGEHRRVGFGFLSYSLPLDAGSSRAWRICWDPIFFELCQASGSALSFDLATYRKLDGASRRLYLLLKKIFWRHEVSPEFDVRHLAVSVLGFAGALETWKLKQKVVHCAEVLLGEGMIQLPTGVSRLAELIEKKGAGSYSIRFHRGAHFDRVGAAMTASDVHESPCYDQLRSIGLDDGSIRRVLSTYKPRMIAEWADVTLAARERKGAEYFTTGPQAHFLDNLKHAAKGTRTPPDWFRQMRVDEERQRRENHEPRGASTVAKGSEEAFAAYLRGEAQDAFHRLMDRVFSDLQKSGVAERDAREKATHIAKMNLRAQFRRDHPGFDDDGPRRAFDLLTPHGS